MNTEAFALAAAEVLVATLVRVSNELYAERAKQSELYNAVSISVSLEFDNSIFEIALIHPSIIELIEATTVPNYINEAIFQALRYVRMCANNRAIAGRVEVSPMKEQPNQFSLRSPMTLVSATVDFP